MSAADTITVTIEAREEAGDGTPCVHCGDPCWLNQFRIVLVMPSGENAPQPAVICGSCIR